MNESRRAASRGLFFIFGILVLAAIANALAFAATTANWVPTSDNWFYLDRIVYPYAHGHFDLGDLLVKRGALDHSQPLRRLLLLADYEWFDLDFRIEAIFAVLAGIVGLGVLGWGMRQELRDGMPASGLAFTALAATYFSLSATVVFTYSLLALGFTSHVFLFLWLLASWAVLETQCPRRIAMLVASTFLFGLVADDTAYVAVLAVAIATVLYAWRGRISRRGACLQIAASVAGICLYLAFYRVAAPATIAVDSRTAALQGVQAQGLFHMLGDAWQWIVVPLASPVAHRATLRAWLGDAAGSVVVVLGVACVLAHLWFWKRVLTGTCNRTSFMATAIMLLFYGLVAGIVLGRITVFGSDYLWQPRYAFIYRWHLLALLMMLIAQPAAAARPERSLRWLAPALAALLLVLQVPLGIAAWKDAKYIRHANANFAGQILAIGSDAGMRPPTPCAAQLTVCKFDDARRHRIIGFLSNQRLSVFSVRVRERNDYPED